MCALRRRVPILGFVGCAVMACVMPAHGQSSPVPPSAIVEEADAGAPLNVLDYVSAGQVIRLAPGQTLVIGYVASCVRETIVGGLVTVGTLRSEVIGGEVLRERVACDGGRLRLSPRQGAQGAAMTFRGPALVPLPSPSVTLYGCGPLVELSRAATLTIERLDVTGFSIRIAVTNFERYGNRFLDLAALGVALAPGGLYRATAGKRSVVFSVASTAGTGVTPLLGRLLRI